MIQKFFSSKALGRVATWQIVKSLLLFFNVTALCIYATVRSLTMEFPFELEYELLTVAKVLGVASLSAVAISLLILLVEAISYFYTVLFTSKDVYYPSNNEVVIPTV